MTAGDRCLGYCSWASNHGLHRAQCRSETNDLVLNFHFQDELKLVPNSASLPQRSSKRSKTSERKGSSPHRQPTLDNFLSQSQDDAASSSSSPPSPFSRVIEISDSKTRGSPSIPRHADTLPSRLQLMLYHHLLEQILEADPAMMLDFFNQASCDVARPFSNRFKLEMSQLVVINELHLGFPDSGCLLDMLIIFQESMETHIPSREISNKLSLVYRKRKPVPSKEPGRRPDKTDKAMEFVDVDDGKDEIEKLKNSSGAVIVKEDTVPQKRKAEINEEVPQGKRPPLFTMVNN